MDAIRNILRLYESMAINSKSDQLTISLANGDQIECKGKRIVRKVNQIINGK